MFRLGVITDEVSQDLKAAIDFALEFGLRGLEIRTASGKNIMDMTTDEVKEIRKMADGSGLEVPSISSPVFKLSFIPAPSAIFPKLYGLWEGPM